ncbi:flagellin N-terminal helical domain-containing protein [Tuberibacillus sp. Marseille-P3662]|uniref:flagellin N-terminal helical domain-containing protein n=1 Tax=Tuberibacillus sp. Marseille-P3662 TaxID=1965358 RepID=UPI000A1C93C4|nr:flagellin [Tuberibacillus sp. Marseille-P3662]
MRINHNIAALNTQRQLSQNNQATQNSLEKLSSGMRINSAADDAAGLAISEKMRGQIRGLEQAQQNAQDGISLIQTAEGALNETQSILQRMRELSTQASNDTNTNADRQEIQKEVDALVEEIDRVADTTEFNTKKLINGDLNGVTSQTESVEFNENNTDTFSSVAVGGSSISNDTSYNVEITGLSTSGTTTTYSVDWTSASGNTGSTNVGAGGTFSINNVEVTMSSASVSKENVGDQVTLTTRKSETNNTDNSLNYQIGANSSQVMGVSIGDMSASGLNVDGIDVTTQRSAEASISAVQNALDDVSGQRAELGAFQNRLEHSINNLGTSAQNLTSAESRIRDVDMAKEMMEYTKNNILNQAAQSMLAKANQQPQGVLQLLR